MNLFNSQPNTPHIALLPSAGMGHLIPFLRLAAMLSNRNCLVTVITAKPTVSIAEATHISSFISTHPEINFLELQIIPFDKTSSNIADPFFLQFEAIRRSVHLLSPILSSSSPPFSAIFSDVTLSAFVADVAADVSIPNYIVFTSSAKFLSLMAYLPISVVKSVEPDNYFNVPGTFPLPKSSIPPSFSDPDHSFTKEIVSNSQSFSKSKGILINTYEWFESEAITALNNGSIVTGLPPVFPIGPLKPFQLEKRQSVYLQWLDNQSPGSVVYMSFGSRTASSKDQIREIGKGLDKSGFKFIWVLKSNKVDKDDTEELKELLGDTFLEQTKNKGIIVKEWVSQDDILGHPAIGCFISHCGWNSVTEASEKGVPILAWPQNGDQRVNAEVVARASLGACERDWGWAGERLVMGDEIAEKITEIMEDDKLKSDAKKVGEEARKAWGSGGSSEQALASVIEILKLTVI